MTARIPVSPLEMELRVARALSMSARRCFHCAGPIPTNKRGLKRVFCTRQCYLDACLASEGTRDDKKRKRSRQLKEQRTAARLALMAGRVCKGCSTPIPAQYAYQVWCSRKCAWTNKVRPVRDPSKGERHCRECFGLAWRRPRNRACGCGHAWEPERIDATAVLYGRSNLARAQDTAPGRMELTDYVKRWRGPLGPKEAA